jgi:hypothetical protein
MTPTPPSPQPALSMRPFVPVCRLAILSSSSAAPPMSAVPLALGPGRPAPAGGASTAAPAGGAGGGAPVDTLAGTGVPAPTPRASLTDMMRDVAYAGMNSVANVNICLKIVGVTSLSQRCLSKKKEVVSVRLLQFGFTATDLEDPYMAVEGEKDDSPAVDNAPAAALTDDQLEPSARQRRTGYALQAQAGRF